MPELIFPLAPLGDVPGPQRCSLFVYFRKVPFLHQGLALKFLRTRGVNRRARVSDSMPMQNEETTTQRINENVMGVVLQLPVSEAGHVAANRCSVPKANLRFPPVPTALKIMI